MLWMILRIDAQIDRASGHAYVSPRHALRCSYIQYISDLADFCIVGGNALRKLGIGNIVVNRRAE